MKTETDKISEVYYINEIFPLCDEPQHMPINFYREELKESIIQLSELMLTLDRDDRTEISDIMVKVSGAHKLLTNLQQAVLEYKAGIQ